MIGSAARARPEAGTALLEVVLTVSLMLVLLGAIFEVHTSFLFSSRRQDSAIAARSVERLAIAELSRTVRIADTIWPPSGAAAAREELTLTVPRRDGSGPEVVRLRRDLSGGTVLRETLDAPGGSVLDSRVIVAGVVDDGTPFVAYRGADGASIDPGLVGPAALVGCTMSFELHVAIAPGPGRSPVQGDTRTTPRSRRVEELSC